MPKPRLVDMRYCPACDALIHVGSEWDGADWQKHIAKNDHQAGMEPFLRERRRINWQGYDTTMAPNSGWAGRMAQRRGRRA